MQGRNEHRRAHSVAGSDLVKYVPESIFQSDTGALSVQAQTARTTGIPVRLLPRKYMTHGISSLLAVKSFCIAKSALSKKFRMRNTNFCL